MRIVVWVIACVTALAFGALAILGKPAYFAPLWPILWAIAYTTGLAKRS